MPTHELFTHIKKALSSCHRPLIFFDDDPDGLCAFLQVYKFIGDGHGIVVKSRPILEDKYLQKIEEYSPDKVIVLDIPAISEQFIRGCKPEIIWIDHHTTDETKGTTYFNPKDHGMKDLCTTATVYNALKKHLWIAAIGSIADWTLPDFMDEFQKAHPTLMPEGITAPDQALFTTRAGELARIFSFLLKSSTREVMKSVKVLTRIETPEEIINESTAPGKYLMKRIKSIRNEYDQLLEQAKKSRTEDKFLVFQYSGSNNSLTNDLANHLIHLYPDNIVIVGREKSGEVKMSLRSPNHNLPPILSTALQGVEGYGGGHEHACGSCVKKDDFDQFLQNLRNSIN